MMEPFQCLSFMILDLSADRGPIGSEYVKCELKDNLYEEPHYNTSSMRTL
jgi:hypothetical protein